jgi:cathepsin L
VRNSWSPAWGEAGYIRISMTSSPQCGTDLNPSVRASPFIMPLLFIFIFTFVLPSTSTHSRCVWCVNSTNKTTQQDGTGCKGGPPTQRVCGTCGILFDNSYPIV